MRCLLCAFALVLMLIGCNAKRRQSSDLRARIIAGHTSQYCHPPLACANPHILAFESGYLLTSFTGTTPRSQTMHPEELRERLLSLPMTAWPQGTKILISPSDDVMDWQSIQKNLKKAEQTCRSLGLMFNSVPVVKSANAMKKLSILVIVVLSAANAVAQSDLCWRDPYPWLPGEWAGSGSAVEAGNRFQVVPGATVELWSTTYKYDDARQNTIHHQVLPASLVETAQSDSHGAFVLNTLRRNNKVQPGSYEIRVYMPGRENTKAYTQIGGPGPQWMGRGIKVALSQEGKGCSRIYSAGVDDTDCGVLDCEKLPAGRAQVVFSDGTPLADHRLHFYQHSKKRSQNPEFSMTTDSNGMITTPQQRGCFDVAIEHGGSMHLCFSGLQASGLITVMLPPKLVQ